jgi:hypothetical protein
MSIFQFESRLAQRDFDGLAIEEIAQTTYGRTGETEFVLFLEHEHEGETEGTDFSDAPDVVNLRILLRFNLLSIRSRFRLYVNPIVFVTAIGLSLVQVVRAIKWIGKHERMKDK